MFPIFSKAAPVERTTADVLSSFTVLVDELNGISAREEAKVAELNAQIAKLNDTVVAAGAEAEKARAAAGRILALVG